MGKKKAEPDYSEYEGGQGSPEQEIDQAERSLVGAGAEGDEAEQVPVESEYPIVNGRPDSPYYRELAARHMSHS